MLLRQLAELSHKIGTTRKRNEKLALLAECLRGASPEERRLLPLYLAGELRQSKLGVGYSQLASVRATASDELRGGSAQLGRRRSTEGVVHTAPAGPAEGELEAADMALA